MCAVASRSIASCSVTTSSNSRYSSGKFWEPVILKCFWKDGIKADCGDKANIFSPIATCPNPRTIKKTLIVNIFGQTFKVALAAIAPTKMPTSGISSPRIAYRVLNLSRRSCAGLTFAKATGNTRGNLTTSNDKYYYNISGNRRGQ